MTDDVPALELRGVSKTFSDGTVGLRAADLVIARGELVAIVGPSGAGKSTLLNLMGLLDAPDSGDVRIGGVSTRGLSEESRDALRGRAIGFVFQSSYVLPEHDVVTNAALAMRTNGVRFAERSSRARHALDTVGLQHRTNALARTLSGGERQRLAIARALSMEPSVILADEPTGNLDQASGTVVLDHLRAATRSGTTVVLVTHDPVIARAADRSIHVLDGSVRPDDIPTGLTAGPAAANPGAADPATTRPRSAPKSLGLGDAIVDVLNGLAVRLGRAALLVVAFALGVGGLVAAMGASETASMQVTTRLTAAALDEVRATPRQSDPVDTATMQEWMAAAASLPHVVEAGVSLRLGTESSAVRRTADAPLVEGLQVFAATPSLIDVMEATITPSHAAPLLDGLHGDAIVLGPGAAAELGIARAGPGVGVWMNGKLAPVVGIVESGREDWDRAVIVTPSMAQGLHSIATLVVRTEPGYPAPVAEALPLALDIANPGRFTVETVADLRSLRYGVASDLQIFVAIIAAVLLLLACVGAAATMYMSVLQRTQEIALRRAIGASRHAIALLFVLEGATVGAAGGAIGAFAGSLATLLIASSQGWQAVLSPGLVPLSVLVGIAAGMLSAIVPAIAASRRQPAEALRGG